MLETVAAAPPARPTPRALPLAPAPAVEAKRSNCVEGFQYNRWKGILYTVGIVGKLFFLPLWPFFLAKEAKDWSIARNYGKTMLYCLKAIYDHVRYGSFLRLIKYNMKLGPEEVQKRIDMRRGACTRCAKCCRAFNCIFLGYEEEKGEYYCKVFQTSYWYYGTCGRYPIDQRDIDDHGCPGFSFPPVSEAGKAAARGVRLPVAAA